MTIAVDLGRKATKQTKTKTASTNNIFQKVHAKLDTVFSVKITLCLLAANFVVTNSLDQDQDVGADLGPIYLTR